MSSEQLLMTGEKAGGMIIQEDSKEIKRESSFNLNLAVTTKSLVIISFLLWIQMKNIIKTSITLAPIQLQSGMKSRMKSGMIKEK